MFTINSVQISIDPTTLVGVAQQAGVSLVTGTGGALAALTITENGGAFRVIYQISAGGVTQQSVESFGPLDTSFHTYVFTIDSALNATWSRDGVIKFIPTGQSVDTNVNLRMGPAFGVVANFDEVLVTSP